MGVEVPLRSAEVLLRGMNAKLRGVDDKLFGIGDRFPQRMSNSSEWKTYSRELMFHWQEWKFRSSQRKFR